MDRGTVVVAWVLVMLLAIPMACKVLVGRTMPSDGVRVTGR